MQAKVKVCGMRHQENIEAVLAAKPDFLGFIFFEKSARCAAGFPAPLLPKTTQGVGVFVNENTEIIIENCKTYGLSCVQLHGKETPEQAAELKTEGFTVIKVFSVGVDFDFSQLEPYEQVVDFFLFDTKGKLPGGNGTTFDWSLLKEYPSQKPYFLSGGIGPEHVKIIQQITDDKLYAVDVNSCFEIEPGLKNPERVKQFISDIKNTHE